MYLGYLGPSVYEPLHDKTNKMAVRPVWSESSLSAWRSIGSLATHWAQHGLWSDWADAQADLSLRWAHTHFVLSCRGSYVHIKPFLISAIWRQFILLMFFILHRVVFTFFLGYKLQGKICEWEVFSRSQKHIFHNCSPPPPRSQRHLEISNKMESFPSYGSRIFFFHYFWGHIIFLVPLLSHFIFFLAYQEPKYFLR